MKFALNLDHRRFFYQNQAILLEELLSKSQQDLLVKSVSDALTLRIGPTFRAKDPDELFVEGNHLHCENSEIRQIATQKRTTSLIGELLNCRVLRLGPDQYLPSNRKHLLKEEDPYGEFLKTPASLKEFSCIQGVVGGLLFCLEVPRNPDPSAFFPSNPGDGMFFTAEKQIPFPYLNEEGSGSYILFTYTEKVALYLHQEKDPHLHALKHWGYVFGDKLREPNHPLVLR